MKKLKGVLAPAPTLIDEKRNVDLESNLATCQRLLESEIGGLFLLGTTGEFAYFSVEDRKKYIEFMCEKLITEKPVVYCVQHTCTKYALEMTEFALQKGAKYIAALLPVYFEVTDEGIKRYFRSIRKTIDEFDTEIPLYMYHIPIIQSTAEASPEIVIELAEEGTLAGIKDSVFELSHAQNVLEGVDENFNFLCGTEPLLEAAVNQGDIAKKFDGGVFTGVNIMPNSYSRLINAAIKGDLDTYHKIKPHIDGIIESWSKGVSYLPAICKYALKYQGYPICNLPCEPLELIDSEIKENIETAIENTRKFWKSDDI